MQCKTKSGKKFCLINGKWVEMENQKKAVHGGEIKYSRPSGKRTGVC